jgi:glycosyltransferase involved in cell wall biosynthesis
MQCKCGRFRGVESLVSVITVALNAAATIDDTIASVFLQQENFGVEQICVDGGSTDGTREIIDSWVTRGARIRRVYETDDGIFDAMNKGLRAARGEYVLFLNADDFLVAPDSLARAMRGLSSDMEATPDLILGDVVMGEPGVRGLWRHRRVPRLLSSLRGCGLIPLHQGMFSRRLLLERAGGFDAKLRTAADTTLFYDLERRFAPSIRLLGADVACMKPGGAANAGLPAIYRGSVEIYRHLRSAHGRIRAAAMVMVKTAQSLSELRYGRVPHQRWFERQG